MDQEQLRKIGIINEFLSTKGITKKSANLCTLQRLFTDKLNIRPLVGMRMSVGTYTADTYIYRIDKSTAAKPHWEKVFSPFSFSTYEEALLQSLMQAVENVF